MIFVKARINDDIEISVDLYGDEFRSYCPKCGMEHDVSPETIATILLENRGLGGTAIYCEVCTENGVDTP